jgi:hypothetical protein
MPQLPRCRSLVVLWLIWTGESSPEFRFYYIERTEHPGVAGEPALCHCEFSVFGI